MVVAAKVLLASVLLAGVAATEINSQADWDKLDGKTVFVKFLAPWCGHCKKLKPAWDQLAAEYEGNANVAIVDVDCTTDGGKGVCNSHGVRGYPTIKYGDPADLQEYNGGRTFDDIKKHAETLGPSCSPANIDLCDDAKKADIKKFQAMSSDDREKQIKEKEEAMKKIEGDFEKFVEGLNKQYKEQSEKKDKDLAAIKDSGLSLLKSVNKFEANKKGEL